MFNSIKLFLLHITSILMFFLLLSSCSSYLGNDYQLNHNKFYLDTKTLPKLYAPSNIVLPIQSNKYKISFNDKNNDTNKIVNIYPPLKNLSTDIWNSNFIQ